jgi:hypothetical protein
MKSLMNSEKFLKVRLIEKDLEMHNDHHIKELFNDLNLGDDVAEARRAEFFAMFNAHKELFKNVPLYYIRIDTDKESK